MENPREILKDCNEGFDEFNKTNAEQMGAFSSSMGVLFKKGSLDVKTKELISVAIGIYNRCKYCIVGHSYKALKAGASPEEIMEERLLEIPRLRDEMQLPGDAAWPGYRQKVGSSRHNQTSSVD